MASVNSECLNWFCFANGLSFHSEGKTTVNIIDPNFEGKIRAKVAEMFPFMKPENVSEHYKMIEQVLEDEKMVSKLKNLLVSPLWVFDSK